MDRRLAAILAADLVGYSHLMEGDEARTIERLTDLRKNFIQPLIARYHGRIFKLTGDGYLVEFSSVLDAVECALEWQRTLAEAAPTSEDALQFRIGINLGDVVVEDSDIFGDGVNIAARLESIAEPGQVYVSGMVRDNCRNKPNVAFTPLGTRRLKNISERMHVFRAERLGAATGRPVAISQGRRRLIWLGAGLTGLVFTALVVTFERFRMPAERRALEEHMSFPLPAIPSVAIIPFRTPEGDAIATALSYGLAEQMIDALSRRSDILVTSANSSTKGNIEPRSISNAAERLGVRYIVSGSARLESGSLHVDATLVDALTGRSILTSSSDVSGHSVITGARNLAAAVVEALRLPNPYLSRTDPQIDVETWHIHADALTEAAKGTSEGSVSARARWTRAVQRNPDFVVGWLMIGASHLTDIREGWADDIPTSLRAAEASAERALAIESERPFAFALLGAVNLGRANHAKALELGTRAVALGPNDADALALLAVSQNFAGEPKQAAMSLDAAMRRNPSFPAWYLAARTDSLRMEGRIEEAISTAKTEINRHSNAFARLRLAICYAKQGAIDPAHSEVKAVLKERPRTTIREWTAIQVFADPARLADDEAALRTAGLPEVLSFECVVRNRCP
jgi:adenylate cyclase